MLAAGDPGVVVAVVNVSPLAARALPGVADPSQQFAAENVRLLSHPHRTHGDIVSHARRIADRQARPHGGLPRRTHDLIRQYIGRATPFDRALAAVQEASLRVSFMPQRNHADAQARAEAFMSHLAKRKP